MKLLVAFTQSGTVTPHLETSEQTRLGMGFYDSRRLQPGPIEHTARVVARFAAEARQLGAGRVRVIATSAAREALNAGELTGAIFTACGLTTEIISGEQEADWGFAGVLSDARFHRQPLMILDVGGGSTELILGRADSVPARPSFRRSFPLGSVRCLEQFRCGDTPTVAQFAAVRQSLGEFVRCEIVAKVPSGLEGSLAVGIGGTTAILALVYHGQREFDRDLVEATEFPRATLTGLVERLWAMPLAERRLLPGMPPERADVILFGAAIYEAVLREFNLPVMAISLRGLRYAALPA